MNANLPTARASRSARERSGDGRPPDADAARSVSRSVTLAWTLLALAGALFVALAVAVTQGLTAALDERLMLAFRTPGGDDVDEAAGPAWLAEAMAELTALGGYTIIVLACLFALGALLVARKRAAALFLALCVTGGSLVSTGLKLLFDRPRPDLVEHLDRTFTSSFPSAHAMVSMLAWLTLAGVAARFVEHRGLRTFVLVCAVALSLMIGTSRVFLGVHWPSDVLAGWCMGLAWACGCWLLAHRLSRRPDRVGRMGRSG